MNDEVYYEVKWRISPEATVYPPETHDWVKGQWNTWEYEKDAQAEKNHIEESDRYEARVVKVTTHREVVG